MAKLVEQVERYEEMVEFMEKVVGDIDGDEKSYRYKIETELTDICDDILKLLDTKLIRSATIGDLKVFYLKINDDYLYYLTEFKTRGEHKEAVENTINAYKVTQDIANADLALTYPIRLGDWIWFLLK